MQENGQPVAARANSINSLYGTKKHKSFQNMFVLPDSIRTSPKHKRKTQTCQSSRQFIQIGQYVTTKELFEQK